MKLVSGPFVRTFKETGTFWFDNLPRAPSDSRIPYFRRMKNIVRRAGLLLVALCWLNLAGAAPVWQRLDTDGFTIYSDGSPNDIKEFAVNFAAFRQVLRELFLPAGRPLPRSTLILFRKASSLKKYGPVAKDDDFTLTTFTSQLDDSPLIVLALSGDRERAWEMLFEFETVFALQRAGYFLPIWMTQGTGMVLASLEVEKGKATVGRNIGDRADVFLNSGDSLPWDKFFQIGRGSEEYQGKKQAGVFQTQAWALMHWILLSGKSPRESFERLATKIREKGFMEAVEEATGVPSKQFTARISSHLNKGKSSYRFLFDERTTRAGLQLVAAADAEVHAQLANVLAAAERFDESAIELNQAMALAPDAICVKEAAARQALRRDEKDEAVKLYREAIAAGTKNTRAYLVSAIARIDECGSGGIDYAGGGGPSTEVAIAEIQKALELNPSSMDAYRMLGRALYILPKLTEDRLADLAPALVSGEEGCSVRYYRALLYQRLEKTEECMSDLRIIVNDPDASRQHKHWAQDRLAKMERQKNFSARK